MLFFYDLGIRLYILIIFILSPFNLKARQWRRGRKNLLKHIKNTVGNDERCYWFHFPSLGEFEQGRPVLEELRSRAPGKKIVITFFSPSGYIVRKNYAGADHVFYLPADTSSNAREFILLINPELAVFTKYDYWYHYFRELNENKIPLFVVSAIFDLSKPFFKWYGALHRKMLGFITCIFVQDEASKTLLKGIGITKVIVSGDTRFDQVVKNSADTKRFEIIEEFAGNSPVFIAGSTWRQDEEMISRLAVHYPGWKFIIAPHEIGASRIDEGIAFFGENNVVKYSKQGHQSSAVSHRQILFIDNIGILSSLYQYGTIAYIGGGFGTGLHNTLEAAAFNLPLIIGPEYGRFKEARDLVKLQAAFSYKTIEELRLIMSALVDNNEFLAAGKKAGDYVRGNTGATGVIVEKISRLSA